MSSFSRARCAWSSAPGARGTDVCDARAGDLVLIPRLTVHRDSNPGSEELVAAGIWSDLTARCGEERHHDDMTLLVLRVPDTAADG